MRFVLGVLLVVVMRTAVDLEVERRQHLVASANVQQLCSQVLNQSKGRMGCQSPVEVAVVNGGSMPKNIDGAKVIAFAARRWSSDGGCSITISREWAEDRRVAAHEVCHCVNDYERMGVGGWKSGTTKEVIREREAAATECAGELIR